MRVEAGIRQLDLADAVGVDFSTVSLWETGKRRIPPAFARRLENAILQICHERLGRAVSAQITA